MEDTKILEALSGAGVMQEAYGDVINTAEYLYDTPGFSYRLTRGMYATALWDRQDGRYRPVYETEIDLKIIRAMSWLLVAKVPMARAWTERLLDYTIGSGFDWGISHPSPEVKAYCNAVIDRFMVDVSWSPGLERESFARSIEDGEFLGELIWDGSPGMIVRECDELTEPIYGLRGYVQTDFEPSWSFGVMTQQNQPAKPIGYHFVRDEAGTDWNYAPANRVLHWKRNVRSGAKRGVTDFYTPHLYLSRGDKILGNTAEGTAVQAAIAYIVEHAPNVTQTQASALTSMARLTGTNPVTGATERTLPMSGAKRLDVRNGQKYHAGPLAGTNNAQTYVAVMSAALRLAGSVKAFPEGMLNGDYSNNNYASAIVAQSPFVQGRFAEQAVRSQEMREMIRKVLGLACFHGKFRRFGIERFSDLEPGLEINVIPTKVVPLDRLSLAQSLAIEKAQGWVTDKTAVTELGRDWDSEQSIRDAEPKGVDLGAAIDAAATAVPATGAEKVADTALNGAQVQAASQIVEKVAAGILPRESGVAQLVMFFQLTQQQAEQVMATAGTPAFTPAGTTVAVQPVPGAATEAIDEAEDVAVGGEYAGLSRQQWNRNRKAIADVVAEFQGGTINRKQAGVMLGLLGLGAGAVADLLDDEAEVLVESEGYTPPEGAQGNAKKVLRWRDEHGDAVQGMTRVGWTRANQLASGEKLSRETVGRMAAFARHARNAEVDPKYKDEPWRDAGYVAWLGWGGDTGVNWAAEIVAREKRESIVAREAKLSEAWNQYP